MKKKKKSASYRSQAGFTLVELMVSLSLFIIIVLALIGSLYTVNDASRKVQAMRTVMDNINFSMEAMARTIRTSDVIVCGSEFDNGSVNCPFVVDGGSDKISVRSTLGEHRIVEYRWVQNATGRGTIQKRSTGLIRTTDPVTGGVTEVPDYGDIQDWVAMTAPEIDIDKMVFYVDGAEKSDSIQPNVILQLEGVATIANGTTVPFAIQTYLSQRTPE